MTLVATNRFLAGGDLGGVGSDLLGGWGQVHGICESEGCSASSRAPSEHQAMLAAAVDNDLCDVDVTVADVPGKRRCQGPKTPPGYPPGGGRNFQSLTLN